MKGSFWLSCARLALVVFVSVLGFLALYYIIPLIYPFIFALILALMFNPFVNLLERKVRFPRWLAVTVSIILLLAIVVSLVTLVIIEIVAEINKLGDMVPQFIEEYIVQIQQFFINDIPVFYNQLTTLYSSLDPEVQRNIDQQIEELTNNLIRMGQNLIQAMLNSLLSIISAIPYMATALVISLIAAFFISKDWHRWSKWFLDLIPEPVQIRGGSILKDLRNAIFGFIKAQLTLISITFVIVLCGLLILRVEYALTIALLIGLVDLLPYLGTGLIFIPWIVYLFLTGQYKLTIGLSILYGVVLVQRQLMEPKILGTNVGLDPLLTLFSLYVGFILFGLAGIIIGPVSMVVLGALHRAGVFKDLWAFIRGTS